MRALWICTLLIAGAQIKPIANAMPADGQDTQAASGVVAAKILSHRHKSLKIVHAASRATPARMSKPVDRFLSMPLDFERNQGQAPSGYAFVAHGPSYALGISANGMALTLPRRENKSSSLQDPIALHSVDSSNLELRLVGANNGSQITGLEAQPGRSNYFIGNDPANWRREVPHFGRVKVAAAYPGIDLVFHGDHRQLEYDFDVAPGADPGRIRLEVQGAKSVTVDSGGNALLHTAAGNIELKHPVAYQEITDVRHPVKSAFQVVDGKMLEFEVGRYDRNYALTIDPVLVYSVTFGGSGSNQGMGLTQDAAGDTYVTGNTCSSDFPSTAGNFQSMGSNPAAKTCQDAFVVKLDPTASTLIFSDFIGGAGGPSTGAHVAVDSSQNVYVAGATGATNFPTVLNIGKSGIGPCAIATKGYDCPDGFVLKLSSDGSELLFSSLLGGSQASGAFQVKLNPVTGDLDVLGETNSSDFMPAPTTLETTFGGGTCSSSNSCFNSFLLGLDPSTGKLRYGTFLGGTGNDWSSGLAFDKNGNIYVAGSTQPPLSSSLGTVTHTYAPTSGVTAGANLFVAKLNLSGTTLTPGYLTILQGDADTGPTALAVDSNGYAYFAGATAAHHLAVTASVFQSTNNATNGDDCLWGPVMTPFLPSACGTGLVGKLDATGALSFLTYLGGSGQDEVQSIAVDSNGNLWLTGVTSSMDFPLTGNYYGTYGFLNTPFLAEMSNDGTQLPFATLNGSFYGQSSDVFVDASNNVYIAGSASTPPSTPGVYPENPNDFSPVFLQKWTAGTAPTISVSPTSLGFPTTSLGASSPPQTITIQNTGSTAVELGIQLSNSYSDSPISDFLESTNCGSSLAANSSCTITVTFAPGPALASCVLPTCSPTARSAEIFISNNAIEGEQMIVMTGASAVGPSINVSPNPIVFPAQSAGTSSAPLYVSAENAGDSTLSVSNIALGGPNASDFQLTLTGVGGNNCNVPLQPGSLCDLDVTFSPPASATGSRTAALTFTDNAGDSPQTVNITGTVAASYALIISPLTVSPTFPVAIGTSSYGVLSFENPSTTNTVQVTSLPISGTNAGDFSVTSVSCSTAGSLPMTIAPGATCYADVTFNPAAGASGLRTASMTVGTSPAISGLPTIALQGDGVTNSQPGMGFFQIPNPMNFGGLQIGETSNNESVLLTINNSPPIPCAGGTSFCGAPLIINSIMSGLADYTVSAEAQSGVCSPFPATIPIGGDCTYSVIFTPAAAGPRNTTLTIQSNDPQGPVQLRVYGAGLSIPLGAFLQTALNFGNSAIGVASPPLTTTLVNEGESALTVSAVNVSTNFAISANTCAGQLAAQAICTISITFSPPTAGFFSGMLTITDNDVLNQQQVVNLTGTGATGPQVRITPQTITFPNQALNTLSAAKTLTFTSTGDSAVTFPNNPISTSQDFILQSSTCAGSLAPGSSCTANVQFRPTNVELVNFPEGGDLLITDNASGSPQPVYMQGTGIQGTGTSSATALVSSLNPSAAGQSVTFTATVTGPSGSTIVPTGSVNFTDGTTTLGSGTLNGSGVAMYSTAAMPAGSNSMTAAYSGDSNFSGSTSNVVTQVVNTVVKLGSTTTVTSSQNPSGWVSLSPSLRRSQDRQETRQWRRAL